MRWDGRGAMDITRGEDVTCQHGIYANNVTGYGRVGHKLWGGGGVADIMDALAVLLYWTHSLACLISSSVIAHTTLSKMHNGQTVII